jgi:DNA polymerase gamma 1
MGPVARLVVGHNVSYDRARVAEEYRLQRSDCAYLDTMSMHICINGMTSGQRNTWRKYRKEDMDNAPDWVEMTAMNSLADLSRLYCKTELSKVLYIYGPYIL